MLRPGFGISMGVAVVAAALLALVIHAISLQSPMGQRQDALDTQVQRLSEPLLGTFEQVAAINASSVERFRTRMAALDSEIANSRFNSAFPDFGDGTRRSAPELFDGTVDADGEHVHGIGAFIGDAETMTQDQRAWFWEGYRSVLEAGAEYVAPGRSLYYFTPDRRMVMLAPHREDRLEFYRMKAPADFNLRADEDPILFGAETNPTREMQCTRLSFYISAGGGERSAMACRTPVWQDEVLLGAFGTSFEMGEVLAASTVEAPSGGVVWVLNADGNVIAQFSDRAESVTDDELDTVRAMAAQQTEKAVERHGNAMFAIMPVPHVGWSLVTLSPIDEILAATRLRSILVFFLLFALFSLAAALISGRLDGLLPRREEPFRPPAE